MKLIIAEKPSMAKAIANAIDSTSKNGKNCIHCKTAKGTEVIVAWLVGHVLEQYMPEQYTQDWKSWNIKNLPMIPDNWKLKEKFAFKGIINDLKELLQKATDVIHAGDPDREGQLLVDEFLEHCKWKGKTDRLLLWDLTPSAIVKSLTMMKDNKEYKNVKDSALARARADWLIGMNISRYFTHIAKAMQMTKYAVSVGRVQTPTLGLVVHRDEEIKNFVPTNHFKVSAEMDLTGNSSKSRILRGIWQPDENKVSLDSEGRLLDNKKAEEIAKKIKNKTATITKYEKTDKKELPPLPYKLSTLQMDANKKLGLTLQQTLDITQSLYEKQIVSYPRSDCDYLPNSHHKNVYKITGMIKKFFTQNTSIQNATINENRYCRAFDDAKVAEHYAITPTGKIPSKLTDEELSVFNLICERYFVQFMPDYEYKSIITEFSCENEIFKSIGKEIINTGWRGFSPPPANKTVNNTWKKDEEMDNMPEVKLGERGNISNTEVLSKVTTPPRHFTDGTLVEAMNNIHNFVQDKNIKQQLKEVEGIGTASTQAKIIDQLISTRHFIQRTKNNELRATPEGINLIYELEQGIGKDFTVPDMTAIWEGDLKKIESGEMQLNTFLDKIVRKVTTVVTTPVDINLSKEKLKVKPSEYDYGKSKYTGKKSTTYKKTNSYDKYNKKTKSENTTTIKSEKVDVQSMDMPY